MPFSVWTQVLPLLALVARGTAVAPLSDAHVSLTAAEATTDRGAPAGSVVQPEIVVPGEWLADKADKFIFLPLEIPKGIGRNCKIMSNGDSILVVVTEKPEEKPETNAMKKYKLVVEAIKAESGHDERALKARLSAWLSTEDDDEVRVYVKDALDSLTRVRKAKQNTDPRIVSVPLGVLQVNDTLGDAGASRSLLLRGSSQDELGDSSSTASRIIKESFAVEIPYAAPVEKIFVLERNAQLLLVGMPFHKNSLDAKGISTGGKAFARLPVFDAHGKRLLGTTGAPKLAGMLPGLDLHALLASGGLKPLQV